MHPRLVCLMYLPEPFAPPPNDSLKVWINSVAVLFEKPVVDIGHEIKSRHRLGEPRLLVTLFADWREVHIHRPACHPGGSSVEEQLSIELNIFPVAHALVVADAHPIQKSPPQQGFQTGV